MTFNQKPVLAAKRIAKAYGSTRALVDASLSLQSGRVHALLGENGAGKSTLLKILVGAVAPDQGTLELDGEPAEFRSVIQAIERGIVPVYQHLSLFPQMSVRENLSAFALCRTRALNASNVLLSRREAQSWLDRVGLRVGLEDEVKGLSIGERQLLEIARALGQNCRVLVLDEPTAALTGDETARLFAVVRRLCDEGTAVLFISHKFDEIEQLGQDVTVLRDGRTVICGEPIAGFTRETLVRAMLGEALTVSDRVLPAPREVVLRAERLRVHKGSPPIDLEVRAGEIVGLTGLVGSGALEIGAALACGSAVAGGSLIVAGRKLRLGDRRSALATGIGYVPSDRQTEGLFAELSALENASASCLDEVTRAGTVSADRQRRTVVPWLRRLKLQPLRLELEAAGFSGGNQQKLLLARNLALPHLKVLVLLEPTRGVDIAARELIHDAIVECAGRGVAVVLASTDLEEVLALSHRVLVVALGALRSELPRGSARDDVLAALATRAAA